MKRQTDNLSFPFSNNLAYAEQTDSTLWIKSCTFSLDTSLMYSKEQYYTKAEGKNRKIGAGSDCEIIPKFAFFVNLTILNS